MINFAGVFRGSSRAIPLQRAGGNRGLPFESHGEEIRAASAGGSNGIRRQPKGSMKHKGQYVLAILAMVSAALIVFFGTRWGPAASDDTLSYVMAGENLVQGHGLTILSPDGSFVPLTHFPPMLSILISLPVALGAGPLEGLRWLYAILFGVNTLLTAISARSLTRSLPLGIFAGVSVLISETMILVHTEAMSEGLFLLFSLGTLILLDRYLDRRRLPELLLAAAFAAAASLTRYVGGAVILTGTVTLVRCLPKESRSYRAAVGFLLIASLPITLWAGRNLLLMGNPFARSVDWLPVDHEFIVQVVSVVLTWFLPGRFVQAIQPHLAVVTVLATVVAAVLYLYKASRSFRTSQAVSRPLLWSLAIYGLIYLAAIVVAKSLFDERIFIDNRMLSPLLQPLIILFCVGVNQLVRVFGRRVAPALGGCLLVLGLLWVQRAWTFLTYAHESGRGYTSRGYHSSDTIATVRRLEEVPVYTNAAAAVYFWTGRSVHSLGGVDVIKRNLAEDCGVIVVFDSIAPELYGTTKEEISLGLVQVERRDGDFFFDAACSKELETLLGR